MAPANTRVDTRKGTEEKRKNTNSNKTIREGLSFSGWVGWMDYRPFLYKCDITIAGYNIVLEAIHSKSGGHFFLILQKKSG